MLKKKKITILKEEELDKISGGYISSSSVSFEKGECYSDKNKIYKIPYTQDKLKLSGVVICDVYDKHLWDAYHEKVMTFENMRYPIKNLLELDLEEDNYI